ncbi:response regulator [Glaciibacter sp. 2TAF33]|uniref:response regulator n=1 Tax=Glaciibacter sp. 2TAF33 TaxID=3233015 RepID=UPI003F8FC40D
MIRVFLLDDHEVVRRGVANLLDAEPDIEVVGEASTAAQARGRIEATRPDIAILDVRLPDGSGIDVCRSLHAHDSTVHCIMLTGYDDEDALYAAVIAGAAGYVVKDIQAGKLVESVRAVAAGRSLIAPGLARRAVDSLRRGAAGDTRLDALSGRERQVLALVADGLTNRQIGEELALAEKTVKNYVSSVLAKLGLQRRTQAAIVQLESRQP